jgi:hypothetical protein
MSSTVYTHTSLYSSAVSSQCLHLQLEPHLRGPVVVAWSSNSNSNSNSDYNYNDGNASDNGYTVGKTKATSIWESEYGSSCNQISSYDTAITEWIKDHFDYNAVYEQTSNEYYFKKGATNGMMYIQKQHDMTCGGGGYDNNDDYVDIDSCSRVGTNTASDIVEQYVNNNVSTCSEVGTTSFSPPPQYNSFGNINECITVANDDCMGNIDHEIKSKCFASYDSYDVLTMLKGKCRSQVSMTIKKAN